MTTATGHYITADNPDRDAYTTPLWIARAVGPVWLDCCSNERSVMTRQLEFRLDCGQDGLELAHLIPRHPPGIVWCNPPYGRGEVLRWVRAYRHTSFCFLLRHDSSTKWFKELFAATGVIAQPHDRVDFDPPPGIDPGPSNPYPHSLFYRDERDVSDRIREICYIMEPRRKRR